jgi:hypothetical protein
MGGQILTAQEFHYKVGAKLVYVIVEKRHDVRVRQGGYSLCLTAKSLQSCFVERNARP